MLKIVILSLLGVSALQADPMMKEKIMQKINKYNLMSRCFGDEMMTSMAIKIHKACEFCEDLPSSIASSGIKPIDFINPPLNGDQINALRGLLSNPSLAALLQPQGSAFGFGRKKRAAGLLDPTEEDRMEFMEDLMDFKQDMHTKMGNLSCVLTQLGMLDAAGNINTATFSVAALTSMYGNTPAGSDPVFVNKLSNSLSDCYDISRNWPQQALDRHPLTQKYGRHMVFFECAKKMKVKVCAQFEIKQWMELMYGSIEENAMRFGLPGDVYDAATMGLMVKYSGASEEMRFVDDFFWGKVEH